METNANRSNPNQGEISYRRELIVIARPEVGLRASPAGVASLAGSDVSPLADLLAAEGAAMQPLFGESEEGVRAQAAELAPAQRGELPDLSTFYYVQAPDERLDDLAERLRALETIEAAYVKPPGEPPVAPAMTEEVRELVLNTMQPLAEEPPAHTPNFTGRQVYLNAAPEGVDAYYAWGFGGGRGAGVKIIDCEWGWRFTHEDLLLNQMGVVVGVSSSSDNHGTAVLGEYSGDSNPRGVTGICSDATAGAASFVTKPSAQAIREAADQLNPGDIILLEIHRAGPRFGFMPRSDQRGYIAIEWWPDDFAAIQYAVSKGIIVVEAAGNGAENLDDALYDVRPAGFPATWTNPFNPANPSSQAVLVGAGNPPAGIHGRNAQPITGEPYVDRARCGFSNYGARLDAQGWGWEVTSSGYGDLQGGGNQDEWYTDQFSGTSSASPIAVGVLGCLQGIVRAQGGTLITSPQARSLLRSTGSPQQDAPGRPSTQRIGNRPNLRQLIPLVARVWHYNLTVTMTFASYHSQNCWAYLQGIGWRKIKPGATDGVTEMFDALCEAVANGQKVHLEIDPDYIYTMYLI